MMNQLAYWRTWPRPLNFLFWMLLALVAGSILYYILAMATGESWVIAWQAQPQLQALPTALPAYPHPLLPVQTMVDAYVLKQVYWGSNLQVNTWAAYLSLALCLLGVSVVLAAITTLTRFWFLVGMGLFVGLVMLLQLEQLGVAGRYDNTAVAGVFIGLLPLTYYLHAFRQRTGFLSRLLLIGGAVLICSLAIGYLARVSNPALYVMNYGLPAWLGLTALLLVVISPEILVAILTLITRNTNDLSGRNRNVQHFLVIAGIYLLNLVLYYLEERGYLNLGLLYLGPFWIFPLSLIISFWTLRYRAGTLSQIVQLEPYGMILVAGLNLVGLSTAAYAAATANTPLLETLEDAILYTHLGFGIAFILYLIINFYGLLRQGQPVYKIMYRPAVMPVFTARLAGLIIAVAFYSLQGSYVLYTPLAGLNNAIGDIYTTEDNVLLAQQYYRLSNQYKFANHRANYALASLAIAEDQPVPATIFLKQTLERNPSAYAYANLSNLYQQNNLAFDAAATLRAGTRAFPQSAELYNNLGLRYYQWQSIDSALHFLQAAALDAQVKPVALANQLALLARSRVQLNIDSLAETLDAEAPSVYINLLALANQQANPLPAPLALPDSIWQSSSPFNPSLLLNYSLLASQADTALANRASRRAQAAGASPYEEQWRLAAALLQYRAGHTEQAFSQLQDLANRSVFNAATYYTLLGQWAMEQNAPQLAAGWFSAARERGFGPAGLYEALALADAGRLNQAKETLLFLPDSALAVNHRELRQTALLALQEGTNAPAELVPPAVKLRLGYATYLDSEIRELLQQIEQQQPEAYLASIRFIVLNSLQLGQTERARRYLHQLSPNWQPADLQEKIALATAAEGQPVVGSWPWATSLARQNREAAITELQNITHGNPFAVEATVLQAHLLNQSRQADAAYALLRSALNLNPHAVPLLKAYALQSLQIGLEQYGEETLPDLQNLVPAEDYQHFEEEFRSRADSLRAERSW